MMSLQSTSLSFFGFRGALRRTSASGFSYARTVAAAQSVKQQMIIMRKELKTWGSPNTTFVIIGQNSENDPAGRR